MTINKPRKKSCPGETQPVNKWLRNTRKLLRLMRQCLLSVYKLPLNAHRNICLPQTPTCILITDSVQIVAVQDLGEHIYHGLCIWREKKYPRRKRGRGEGGMKIKKGGWREGNGATFSSVSKNPQTIRNVCYSVLWQSWLSKRPREHI